MRRRRLLDFAHNGEGHAMQQGIQELGGGVGRGTTVAWMTSQRETISRAVNCLEHHSGHGTHVQGIDLHQVPGPGNGVLPGFAHGVGTRPQRATRIQAPHGAAAPPTGRCVSVDGECGLPWRSRALSPCCRSSTASLSFPQRGNRNRKVKTFLAKRKDQVGWRRRWGQ